ncbi:hypothetical protein [Teredinibacter sp. KSP-S5-2]|uniref:hypothetical protein n=1 Tax=Teredinibacter sp. KSP-S5-2 TaxID=3034506 RepID=UPI002934E8AE|nr:hypothetical protein [Teredinibacter sp. KSP-S5-2]WNO08397.1 hypothetical protein P5V12_15615 [Teredinibacter sp. KSP-S5-2]
MKWLSLVVFLAVSQTAAAAVGWGADRQVTRIIHYDTGDVFIVLEPLAPDITDKAPVCGNNSWLLLKRSHPAFEQMYSASLAALHSGKKLYGYLDPCENVGGTTFRVVRRLDSVI